VSPGYATLADSFINQLHTMSSLALARILIVDDETDLVTALCRVLEAQGSLQAGAGEPSFKRLQIHTTRVGADNRSHRANTRWRGYLLCPGQWRGF
jgi:hypothetical protein